MPMCFDRRGESPNDRLATGGPVDADESVPATGRAYLPVEFEARTAGGTLVGKGFVTVRSHDRRPDPGKGTHCETPRGDATWDK